MVSPGINPSDVGLEVRIGMVSRESARTKAARYLLEHRCILRYVDDDRVVGRVRGRTVYDVEFAPGRGWSCTCAARGRCAHILALVHVTARGDS
jgi:uncharacterized Zn finger protein